MHLALSPVVEQLKQGGYRNVEGLLEFADLREAPRAMPYLAVVPISEDAEGNKLSGRRDQLVYAGLSIMIVLDASRRHTAGIAEDVKTETDRVKDIVVGWTHPEASRPFDYRGGRLVQRLSSAGGSAVVWEVRVMAPYHLRKAS
ncbi:hypothetical protein LZK98_08160 [Sphingomonas cannabina]|uniref:phage tail terminator protein n=1 Tax=Sphingomonas cannabina TaxID=2899123 RepID=UPI001F2C2EB5|nr:hypothetical protein [Sphingomonas cannabina]UIJ46902.1 hypothetical protein LZK98_08160 [Sphingomonas cannabina]